MSLVFWILISFVSASVPWSLILGYIFSNKDIRTVGDKNPGAEIISLSYQKPF